MIDKALEELKHSIYIHVMFQGGPTPQLCVFLTKLLDLMDDLYAAVFEQKQIQKNTHVNRVEKETNELAFYIIESLAIWLANSLDDKFEPHLRHQGQQLLTLVAKIRKLPDKLAAKDIILRSMADLTRALKAANPNITFPDIKDMKNNIL